MSNLLNFFFSFDKLMKEKLVIAFFWLALIVKAMEYFSTALSTIKLGPLAALIDFVKFFGSFLLVLVTIRLICEICVAIFRINDNLSPDGGRSETADIDPIVEARKAAEAAAKRAKEMSQSAAQRTSSAAKNLTDSDVEDAVELTATAPKKRGRPKGSKNKVKAASSAKATPKRKGKPGPKPGSKRKVNKDGVRLKKDGTPAKKPGPKTK